MRGEGHSEKWREDEEKDRYERRREEQWRDEGEKNRHEIRRTEKLRED